MIHRFLFTLFFDTNKQYLLTLFGQSIAFELMGLTYCSL